MPESDLSGTVLDGRYQIIEPIAEGAMGAVYRGERLKLGKAVAIKIMHDVLPDELSSRQRFEREAKLMARLEHPHCVSVLDFGLYEDRPFLVMDLVRGTSVLDLLEKQRRLEIPRAGDIMRQVLSGLAHAHELGIVHRDIKPANIMVTTKTGMGEQVLILDFGLARPAIESAKLTTGIVVGTPNYMAPEQIKGGAIDARTDLYACGVMLFEMITGTKPFVASDPIAVVRKHLNDPPPSLAMIAPDLALGSEIEAVVARALAKDPDARFGSAAEMSTAIQDVLDRRSGRPSGDMGHAVPHVVTTPPSSPQVATSSGWNVPADSLSIPQAAASPSAPMPAPISTSHPITRADSGPIVPVPTSATSSRPIPQLPLTAKQLMIAGGAALVLVIIIAATRGGSEGATPPAKTGDAGVVAVRPDATPVDPLAPALARASDLYANGDLEPALEVVAKARRQHPESAQLAFLGGKIYFAKLWWTDGIKSLRDAIRLDPAYRGDAERIKVALRGFITTRDTDPRLSEFLHDDIGVAARPFLEETARDNPSPVVRARAAAELKRLH